MEHQQTWNLRKDVDLSGVAIMAAVDVEGGLHEVGGEFDKLLAAARERTLPRIHTVIVAEGQRADIQRIDPSLLADDPRAEFRVICADTLAAAINLLKVDADTRWGDIIDCTLEIKRHQDLVERHWLQARVQTAIADLPNGGGYVLLTGVPGMGKSAFIAVQARQAPQPVVYTLSSTICQNGTIQRPSCGLSRPNCVASMPCPGQNLQRTYTPEPPFMKCWNR